MGFNPLSRGKKCTKLGGAKYSTNIVNKESPFGKQTERAFDVL
jgi:hypothetical protein